MLHLDDELFYILEMSLHYLGEGSQKAATKKVKTTKRKRNNKRGKSKTPLKKWSRLNIENPVAETPIEPTKRGRSTPAIEVNDPADDIRHRLNISHSENS